MSPSSPVTVTAGSSVTLECTATGEPFPAVQWIGQELSQSNLQLILGGRGVLKLVIEKVTTKDQGNYTCLARNLVGISRESVELAGKFLVCNLPDDSWRSFSSNVFLCAQLFKARSS